MEEEVSWQKLMGIDNVKEDDGSLSPVFHKDRWIVLRKPLKDKENTSHNGESENNGISSAPGYSQHLNSSLCKENGGSDLCENSKVSQEEIVYHSPIKTRSMKRKLHDHPLSGSLSPRSPLKKKSRTRNRTNPKKLLKQDLYLSSLTNDSVSGEGSNSSFQTPGNIHPCKFRPINHIKRKLIYSTNKLKTQNSSGNIDINDFYKSVIMMEEADKMLSSKVSNNVSCPAIPKEFVTFSTLINDKDNLSVHDNFKSPGNLIVSCHEVQEKPSFSLKNNTPVKTNILNDTLNNCHFTEVEESLGYSKPNGNGQDKSNDLIAQSVNINSKVENVNPSEIDNQTDQTKYSNEKSSTTETACGNYCNPVEKVLNVAPATPVSENAFNDTLNNFQFTEVEEQFRSLKPKKYILGEGSEFNLSATKVKENLIMNAFEKTEHDEKYPNVSINANLTVQEINHNDIMPAEEIFSKPQGKNVFDQSSEELVRFNEILTPTDMFLSELPNISTPRRLNDSHSQNPKSTSTKVIIEKMPLEQNHEDSLLHNTNATVIKDGNMLDGMKLLSPECHKHFEDDFNTMKIFNSKSLNNIDFLQLEKNKKNLSESESNDLTESTDGSKSKVEALLQDILDKPSVIPIQRLLSEEFLDLDSTVVQFSTARGSVVKASQESLDKGKELLQDVMVEVENLRSAHNDSPSSVTSEIGHQENSEKLFQNETLNNQHIESELAYQSLNLNPRIMFEESKETKNIEDSLHANLEENSVTAANDDTLKHENFIEKEESTKFEFECTSRIFSGSIGPLKIVPKLELNSLIEIPCAINTSQTMTPCNQKNVFLTNQEKEIFSEAMDIASKNEESSTKREELMPYSNCGSEFHFFTAGGNTVPVSEESLQIVKESRDKLDYEEMKDNFSPLKLTYANLLSKTSSNSPASSGRLSQEAISGHSTSQESLFPHNNSSFEDSDFSTDNFICKESKKGSDELCFNENKTPLKTPFKSLKLSSSKRLLSLSTRSKRQSLLASENATPKLLSRKTKISGEQSAFQQELKKSKYEAEAEQIMKSPEYDLNDQILSSADEGNHELKSDKSQSSLKPKPFKRKDLLFKTAKGDKVNITRRSLRSARNQLKTELEPVIYEKEADFIVKSPEYDLQNIKPSSLSTAKGMQVTISEKSMQKVKLLFKDDFESVRQSSDLQPLEDEFVLTTATGQGVNISKESIEKVKNIFQDEIGPSAKDTTSISKLLTVSVSASNDFEKNNEEPVKDNQSENGLSEVHFPCSTNKVIDNTLSNKKLTTSEHICSEDPETNVSKYLESSKAESDTSMSASATKIDICSEKSKSLINSDNLLNSSEIVKEPLYMSDIKITNKNENHILTCKENMPVNYKSQSPENLLNGNNNIGSHENVIKNQNSIVMLDTLEGSSKEMLPVTFSNCQPFFFTAKGNKIKISESTLIKVKQMFKDELDTEFNATQQESFLLKDEDIQNQLLKGNNSKLIYENKENSVILSESKVEPNKSEKENTCNAQLENNSCLISSTLKANIVPIQDYIINDRICESESNLINIEGSFYKNQVDMKDLHVDLMKLDQHLEPNENKVTVSLEQSSSNKETESKVIENIEVTILRGESKMNLNPGHDEQKIESITRTYSKHQPGTMCHGVKGNNQISDNPLYKVGNVIEDDFGVTPGCSKDSVPLLKAKETMGFKIKDLEKSDKDLSRTGINLKFSECDSRNLSVSGFPIAKSKNVIISDIFKDDFDDIPSCSKDSLSCLEAKENIESQVDNLREFDKYQSDVKSTMKHLEYDATTKLVPTFSTAKGKKVIISDITLQKVRNIFKGDFVVAPCCSKETTASLEIKDFIEPKVENPKEFDNYQNDIKSSMNHSEYDATTKLVPRSPVKDNNVNISEKASQEEGKILKNDNDVPPCGSKGTIPSLEVKENWESRIENPKESGPFQSGIDANIEHLDYVAASPRFSTAKGSNVVISNEALEKVRNIFKEDLNVTPCTSNETISPFMDKENSEPKVVILKQSNKFQHSFESILKHSECDAATKLVHTFSVVKDNNVIFEKKQNIFIDDSNVATSCSKDSMPYSDEKENFEFKIENTQESDKYRSGVEAIMGQSDYDSTTKLVHRFSTANSNDFIAEKAQNIFKDDSNVAPSCSKVSMPYSGEKENFELKIENIQESDKCHSGIETIIAHSDYDSTTLRISMFSTAKGNNVIISDKALQKARNIFKDDFDVTFCNSKETKSYLETKANDDHKLSVHNHLGLTNDPNTESDGYKNNSVTIMSSSKLSSQLISPFSISDVDVKLEKKRSCSPLKVLNPYEKKSCAITITNSCKSPGSSVPLSDLPLSEKNIQNVQDLFENECKSTNDTNKDYKISYHLKNPCHVNNEEIHSIKKTSKDQHVSSKSHIMPSFSTAKGNHICSSDENILNCPEHISTSEPEPAASFPSPVKNVTISEKSLENIYNIFQEDVNPCNFNKEGGRSEDFLIPVTEHQERCSNEVFPMVEYVESDKLKDAGQSILNSACDLKNHYPLFLTAGGSNVIISEENLLKAKNIFKDELEESFKFVKPEPYYSVKHHEHSALPGCKNIPRSFNITSKASSAVCIHNDIFSTAGGDKVSISEESLNKVKAMFKEDIETLSDFPLEEESQKCATVMVKKDNVNICDEKSDNSVSEEMKKKEMVVMFSTAGGSKVCVSEESLNKVKNMFKEDIETFGDFPLEEKTQKCATLGNHSSKLMVKEDNITICDEKSDNSVLEETKKKEMVVMFSTTGRSKVCVSEESLNKVKDMFKENIETLGNFPLDEQPKKCVTVGNNSSKPLFEEKNSINVCHEITGNIFSGIYKKNSMPVMFSCAGGSKVSASEESLNKVKEDKDTFGCWPLGEEAKKCGTVGDYSYKSMVKEDNINICNQKSDIAKKNNMPMFSTAGGSKVSVSEESLNKIKDMFKNDIETYSDLPVEEEPKKSISVGNISSKDKFEEKGSLNICHEISGDIFPDISKKNNIPVMFSTAGGGKVSISEESLNKVKSMFKEDIDSLDDWPIEGQAKKFVTIGKHSSKLMERSVNAVSEIAKKNNMPMFSTAGGSKVSVSEESLNKVKDMFKEDKDSLCDWPVEMEANWGMSMNNHSSNITLGEGPQKNMADKVVPGVSKNESVPYSDVGLSNVGMSEKCSQTVKDMHNDNLKMFHNIERENVDITSFISENISTFNNSQHNQQRSWLNKNVLKSNGNPVASEVKNNMSAVFSTAGGSSVSVSEDSLNRVKIMFTGDLEPCDDLRTERETKNNIKSDSSSISEVTAQVTLLENCKFNEKIKFSKNKDTCEVKNKMSDLVSTAGESDVRVSNESLSKDKNLFKDDLGAQSNYIEEEAKKEEPCPSVNVSPSELPTNSDFFSKNSKKIIENPDAPKKLDNVCAIFLNSGGHSINVSEESLRQVQMKFNDELKCYASENNVDFENVKFSNHPITSKVSDPLVNKSCAPGESLIKVNAQPQNDTDTECFPNHDSLIFPETPKTNTPLNSQNKNTNTSQEQLGFTPTFAGQLLADELNKIRSLICQKNDQEHDSFEKVSFQQDSGPSETPVSYKNKPKLRSINSTNVSQRRLLYKSQETSEDVGKPYITSPSLCSDRSQVKPLKSCGLEFDSDDDIFAGAETQMDKETFDANSKNSLEFGNMGPIGEKRMSNSSSAIEPALKKVRLSDEFLTINMDKILAEREQKREEQRQTINLKIRNPPPVSQGLYKTIREKETLIKFMEDPLNNPNSYSYEKLLEMGLYADVINVTSKNAVEFQFDGHYFFKEECFSKSGYIDLGSGLILILSDSNKVGLKEISDTFLASPNVDPSLVPEGWIKNHYRWIVWKLASLEKSFPQVLSRRYLIPLNVLHQLKFRYDREIDLVQRPALRRILECDEPASRRFIARVSDLRKLEGDELDPTFELELTDGWYGVWASVDSAMLKLIKKGTVKVGTKLIIQGAELLNCGDGCDPLEIKESVRLKLSTNSVRRVKWNTRMGFTRFPGPLRVGLASILPDGGTVGITSAIVARVYPILYMSKDENGKSVVRNVQAENQIAADFERERNSKSEKLYEEILSEVENKFKKGPKNKIDTKNLKWIMNPPALYRIISQEPEMHAFMSPEQLDIVKKYHEEITSKIQAEVQAALQEKLKDLAPQRQVTTLLKIRIVDPLTESSAMVTIWRPPEELCSLLTENRCIDFHGLNASGMRNNVLQLSSGKATCYKESRRFQMPLKFHRQLCDFSQLTGQCPIPLFGELDIVGVVVHVKEPEKPESIANVYLSDLKNNFLMITFWTSLKVFGFKELLKEGSIVTGTNLHWRQGMGSYVVPSVFANELTCFSSHSTQDYISKELSEFKAYFSVEDVKSFVGARKSTLFSLLKDRSTSTTPVRRVDSIGVSPHIAKRLEKLKSYGPAPPLPKTPLLSSPDIRKGFKPPKINKTSLDSPRV